jgi:hypothetical protein
MRQASTGPFGSPVFASAGKTDPPSRLFLSQTSAGTVVQLWVKSLIVPYFVQFLCSCREARSFVPACASSIASRAGAVKAGRYADLMPRSAAARPRLDGAEHGARIKQVGRLHHWSCSFRTGVLWPAPPRRCGRVCWRARSPARCGAVASWPPRSTTSAHSAPSLLA